MHGQADKKQQKLGRAEFRNHAKARPQGGAPAEFIHATQLGVQSRMRRRTNTPRVPQAAEASQSTFVSSPT